MYLPTALLFATGLSMIVPASAQDPVQDTALASHQDQFTVRGTTVRLWQDNGTTRAAMSRNGGRSWIPLDNPDDVLYFRFAQFDPMRGEISLPGRLGAAADNRMFVVQFRTQILEEYRLEIESRGVEVVAYIPENSYIVRSDRAVAEALRGAAFVRWVGDLQVGFKAEEVIAELLGGDAPANDGELVEYNIIMARKGDNGRLQGQIAAIGGTVTERAEGSPLMQATLTPKQLAQVVGLDTVLWIDRTPEFSTDMDNARIQGGGNYVEAQGGFTGRGVRAEITEYFEETHPDFVGRVLVRTQSVSSHGHCTAGIVGGSGAGNAAARGMMPDCLLIEGGYGGSAHYSMIQGSANPALPWKSMQATASWGGARTLFYTSTSVAMDSALFDFDFVRTQSQSNAGNQDSRPEAWAKNIISVGGVRHGNNANPADDNWTGSASIGPASDGRLKPEVTSYYDGILTSDRSGSAGYNTAAGVAGNYYASFGGTSGATPIVNGHVGLLQQMFTDGEFGNPLPLPATSANRFANKAHAATTKALLCNTAQQYPFSGTGHDLSRYKQGWGFPNVQTAYDNRKAMLLTDEYDVLGARQSRRYLVWVPSARANFKATMVYADPEAAANAAIHRINNVNLAVTEFATGTTWHGNNGLAAGNFSTPGGSTNDRDTVENVILQNPATGIFFIDVTAASIVQDGHVETPALDVDFSLAVHPTGGFHNNTGMQFDLVSTAPGDLRAVATSVPAAGWDNGYTFLSFDTGRPAGFGDFFGVEADGLTSAIFFLPPMAGDAFHFTNGGAGTYPFTTHAFPPALVLAFTGVPIDGMVVLFNGATIANMSNVDRVRIQ